MVSRFKIILLYFRHWIMKTFVFVFIFILCAVISMANLRLTFCSKIITFQFVSFIQNVVTSRSLKI